MAKDLTAKDVRYALEYLGDALERTPIRDGKARWHLRTGATVKEVVANEIRSGGNVSSIEDAGRQIIRWQS